MNLNEKISAPEVRLIDAKGVQLGLVPREEALERAEKDGLDLVEVAPDSKPPVCKIMDFRRHTFDQKRRLKESRKKTKNFELKEIKLRPNIDPHDYQIKLKKVVGFLEKGHKVKISVRYRPREMRHYETGTKLLFKMAEDCGELAEMEQNSRKRESSRVQTMVLSRKKKN